MTRFLFFFGLLISVFVIIFAYYLEIVKNIHPCALCILQRIDLMILAFFFAFGVLFGSRPCAKVSAGFFACFMTLLGMLISGRQVYLQMGSNNFTNGDCGASLSYLFETFPIPQVLQKIYTGSAECAAVNWQFLHLSIAQWAFITFTFLYFISVSAFWRSVKSK